MCRRWSRSLARLIASKSNEKSRELTFILDIRMRAVDARICPMSTDHVSATNFLASGSLLVNIECFHPILQKSYQKVIASGLGG